MGCCCGCPGTACSECSGTPDLSVFVTTSGLSVVTSGTCFNASGGVQSTRLDYTTAQDYSACLFQDNSNSRPCGYGNVGRAGSGTSADVFSPLATNRTSALACPLTGVTPGTIFTYAYLALVSGVYTLDIYAGGNGFNACVLFHSTLTVASPKCRLTTALTFTNAITTTGSIVTYTVAGFTTSQGFAFASGGTASVVFKKSCCP